MTATKTNHLDWWNSLRHGGLLLDPTRLSALIADAPESLSRYEQDRLRRRIDQFIDDPETHRNKFVAFVMEQGLAFHGLNGYWQRGSEVSKDLSRKAITGETVRPQHLWHGAHRSLVPVFIDSEQRLGLGRGKRVVSHALQWLRQTDNRLAVITNGLEWRIVFAGLDYDAFCQWDIDQWFTEGATSPEFTGLRSLLNQRLWTKPAADASAPLLSAINDSRKGQAELSQVLGERVRQAVELLIQGHGPVLSAHFDTLDPAEIYRAGVRIIMRMVVVLFAESRDALLPRDNPIYHSAYSLAGLRDQLERMTEHRRRSSYGAWPRMVSLFRLVHDGSSHEALIVPTYGGQLFEPGDANSNDGVSRALAVLENGCFDHDVMTDMQVYRILDLLSRTKIKIRQGKKFVWDPSPVDFSSLDNEYIGILYEGLLDFELRQATATNPIIFLAVGNQPALPLATLEAMDDKGLKNLLEKMKDTSSGSDEGGEESEGEGEDEATGDSEEQPTAEASEDAAAADAPDDDDAETVESDDTAAEGDGDDRHTIRSRAEAWAQRAIAAGGMVTKPRGKMTEEKKLQYQAALDTKARQIITKVVLPGEWYLVRWGGTRKGSGTYYTRPQLAIPTAHRTLRPLAYDPPIGADGKPNVDAPIDQWIPKRPEHILNLKVCDPACGSGSFLLAALRFLTEALYASLHYHNRFQHFADRTVIDIIRDEANEQTLTDERLPCRPEDADFEHRTKAVLRRYVVERCIYGVDLDPLAVELCRLSLWIETLDPRLPFTFLDHKIKCGNSLNGTWFDQFMHYPAMAWMREGGDKNHSNGVHFKREGWTKAIKEKVADVRRELIEYIDGGSLLNEVDLTSVRTVHDDAERALQAIHGLGIHEADQRATRYRELRSSEEFIRLKEAFDLWCSIWFWPPDKIDQCPLPLDFYEQNLNSEALEISRKVASKIRFFHWELEFPDAFRHPTLGFDVVLGNPPWENLQPNREEYFSAVDPLFRFATRTDKLERQEQLFTEDSTCELWWLDYCYRFNAVSNWVKNASRPFGNRLTVDSDNESSHDFPIGDRGRRSFRTSESRHETWKQKREELTGYADADHPYEHQIGRLFTYRLFLEAGHAILREGGRLGFIVPSGICSDAWSAPLRRLFINSCQWEWLFGFENREKIFDIDGRFKFNPMVIQKGGITTSIKTAFMRRDLGDWEVAEQLATEYPGERVLTFSPKSAAILEIQSDGDLALLSAMYSSSVLLGDKSVDGWGIKFNLEFMMNTAAKLFSSRDKWEGNGYVPDEYGRWILGDWKKRTETCPAPFSSPRARLPEGILLSRDGEQWIHENDVFSASFKSKKGAALSGPAVGLPVYEGRMIGQHDFSEKGWVSGRGRSAVWQDVPWEKKQIEPQYLMGEVVYEECLVQTYLERIKKSSSLDQYEFEKASLADQRSRQLWRQSLPNRVAFMDVTSATNARTMISAAALRFPYGNSSPVLTTTESPYVLIAVLNSLAYDFVARARCGGLHLNWFVIEESVLPQRSVRIAQRVDALSKSLNACSIAFAPAWRQQSSAWRRHWAVTPHERLRIRCMLDAVIAAWYRLTFEDLRWILSDCDRPVGEISNASLPSKGFWRVDKDQLPERRLTILSLIAFAELSQRISELNGDWENAIESFCCQDDGEGWQLPETLRLADYGLGHDDRALEHQPVRSHFGPRFYDWQLEQPPEESWQECHLHARNLLGPDGYQALLDELEGRMPDVPQPSVQTRSQQPSQRQLFDE